MKKHHLLRMGILMTAAVLALTCAGCSSSSKRRDRDEEEEEKEKDDGDSKEKLEKLFGVKLDGSSEGKAADGEESEEGASEEEAKTESAWNRNRIGDIAVPEFPAQVVCDDYDVRVTLKDITEYERDDQILLINFTAENSAANTRRVQIRDLFINGLQVNGDLTETVEPGSTKELSCTIYKAPLSYGGISEIESLEMDFWIDGEDGFRETEPVTVAAESDSAGSYQLAEGTEVFSDEGEIVIRYLGSVPFSLEADDYTLFNMYYSVENHSHIPVGFWQVGEEILVNGAASDDIHVTGDTIDVAPGRDGIIRMEFFAAQGDVTSADFDGMVFMNRESVCEVPLHVRGAGEGAEVQADEPVLTENYLRMVAAQESEAAREAEEQAAEAAVASAKTPEITETGFFAYTSGSSHHHVNCTAFVRNPNTDVYATRLKVKFTALDAAGNVVGEDDYNIISDLAMRPGEETVVSRSFETTGEAASVMAEVEKVEFVALEDGKRREESGNYTLPDDAFSVDDGWKITSSTVMNYTSYYLKGKITSRAAEEARLWLVVVCRDAAGKIIFSETCLMTKVQPGTTADFEEILTDSQMPASEISSGDIIILRD